jgi:hypothetical protein
MARRRSSRHAARAAALAPGAPLGFSQQTVMSVLPTPAFGQ